MVVAAVMLLPFGPDRALLRWGLAWTGADVGPLTATPPVLEVLEDRVRGEFLVGLWDGMTP